MQLLDCEDRLYTDASQLQHLVRMYMNLVEQYARKSDPV
jgi:hypothetical protein